MIREVTLDDAVAINKLKDQTLQQVQAEVREAEKEQMDNISLK